MKTVSREMIAPADGELAKAEIAGQKVLAARCLQECEMFAIIMLNRNGSQVSVSVVNSATVPHFMRAFDEAKMRLAKVAFQDALRGIP